MTDNRSLEEFLGDGTPDESAAGPAAEPDPDPGQARSDTEHATGGEADPEAATDKPVEPMAETVVWSSAGGECARCGAAVEERWRDGDTLVCGDCKAW